MTGWTTGPHLHFMTIAQGGRAPRRTALSEG